MEFDRLLDEDMETERIETMRVRLKTYGNYLRRIDGEKYKIDICSDRLTIGVCSWSSSDAAKGGGSSQEDLQVKLIDEIDTHTRNLKLLELRTRAIRIAIEELDKDKQFIIHNMWVVPKEKRFSYRDCAGYLKMSKTTVNRKSDAALLEIFKKIYLIEGREIDVR